MESKQKLVPFTSFKKSLIFTDSTTYNAFWKVQWVSIRNTIYKVSNGRYIIKIANKFIVAWNTTVKWFRFSNIFITRIFCHLLWRNVNIHNWLFFLTRSFKNISVHINKLDINNLLLFCITFKVWRSTSDFILHGSMIYQHLEA